MNSQDLCGPLLASVSRSFYLSIRILPASFCAPLGLAYLLARASDTIADSTGTPLEARRQHLAAFARMIASGTTDGLVQLQREVKSEHPGERELIARLRECLDALAAQHRADRAEIAAVMAKIIRGQTLDLECFADPARIVALPDASALEVYTYLVAGAVGEFWTRMCDAHFRRFTVLEIGELQRLGVRFGKALQLVNILRDLPADLRSGRCYLPADELNAAGIRPSSLLDSPAAARPVFDRWLRRAADGLDDGFRYLRAVRPARVRAAVFLPWYLGVKTVALLREQYPLTAPTRLKVPRATVRKSLVLAALVAFGGFGSARWLRRFV